ncbi:MAG: hypothetical protein CVV24_03795 [Ignavibacteriae bacterium HGW-Ignavibacteriae-3]|nr:MAG: hypothetical protein CVV24_03795 [Ignavibacteriae bacterium HGW-Ignavibacteriae-3]
MRPDPKNKIAAIFITGYFVSFLRDKLADDEVADNEHIGFLIPVLYQRIVTTLSDLYEILFDEPLITGSETKTNEMLGVTLEKTFGQISEKIQRGGESFLELSFCCGGILGLTGMEFSNLREKENYEVIMKNLLHSLNLNFSPNELKIILRDLTSCELLTRRISRDQLVFLICGNQSHYKQVYEIQNLLESNHLYSAAAMA